MNTWQQKIEFCAHLPARLCLSDPERSMLAEIGKRLERKALAQVASVARPDTILAWYRKLIAYKFDGSKYRRYPGRSRIESKLEALIVQMAKENSGWGYDRIEGGESLTPPLISPKKPPLNVRDTIAVPLIVMRFTARCNSDR